MDSVFEELYQKYHQDIFQFLFYMVRKRELAEDLVQEVYIKVLKSHHTFKGKSSEKTWLFSIARHVAIDYFRKQRGWRKRLVEKFDITEHPIKDKAPLPEEIAMQNEEIQMVYQSLDACTLDQRLVIILRFIQELSIAETAEALGWTESKVKTTQHRALKVLKKELQTRMEAGREGRIDGRISR